jgi:hypothetical protein
MADKFTPPTTCRICGGTMEAGALRTTRENYTIIEGYPFSQLTSSELWYKVGAAKDGKPAIFTPAGGPLMVFHYRCMDCGYLESYAQGKYP